jgi:hypothetical protein
MNQFWEARISQGREALQLLIKTQPSVAPGSRAELGYLIFKTKDFVTYLEVLRACHEAQINFDRALLARINQDNIEFRKRLEKSQAALNQADRLAREEAGQMIAYCDDPTEKYLLFRYNRNVIASIEKGQRYLADVSKLDDINPQGFLKLPIENKLTGSAD